MTFNRNYIDELIRIPSTVISTESISVELIASLIKSQIPQKNDMKFPSDQTLFLKKVILTRELLLPQETNTEPLLTMGLSVRLTSDLGENAVLQHLLSIKLPLEEKTAFFKIF